MRTTTARALRALAYLLGLTAAVLRHAARHTLRTANQVNAPERIPCTVPTTPEPMFTTEQWARILDTGQ